MNNKHSPKNTLPVPPDWEALVHRYLKRLRVGGYPQTTLTTRRHHLHFLARRIGHSPSEVTEDILFDWCAEQNWAPESRRGRNNTYRLFWRWCQAHEGMTNIAENLPKVKQHSGVPKPTPEQVYYEALRASDEKVVLILRLAAEGGLRRGEIASAHTRDLVQDLVGWSLIVHGKGNKQRVVPLPSGLAALLRAIPEGYFFPGDDHGHWGVSWIGTLASRALPDGYTLHSLRARFATLAYSIDHDVFAVQELLGHASPETTRRYVRTNPDRLRRIVQSVVDQWPSGPPPDRPRIRPLEAA